ncbi:O-antigen ligase family protein [Paracidobacterium acidisoli]|uniref:O-antigen ligase family protein n=1 Tax=Paracidobacterium acidisoli TaxID=2303751 RepID=A0A372ISZ8_9BACT|nr:O-antigen ligase family protein [Paracidobacterium acidisoli]MBT9329477.1 O-antigen ligase family protein [Paracidobacterium acidisoli]
MRIAESGLAAGPVRMRQPPLRLPLADILCALIFAFFAVQGAIPGIAPGQALEATNAAPTPLMRIGGIASQVVIDGTILLFLLKDARLLARRILSLGYAALFAALVIFSTLWSIDPLLTLRRSLAFTLAGFFGLWFASRFPLRRQISILMLSMVLLALGAAFVAVCFPQIGLDHSPGHHSDWQGVFTQKNACGRIMVLATAVVLCQRRLTIPRLAALSLFVFVLVMSGSRGAWLIEAAVFVLSLLLRLMRRMEQRGRVLLGLAAAVLTAAMAAAAVLFLSQLTGLLGRDATLSGRTAIWTQVWSFIRKQPWLGYGYGAFWQGIHGPSFRVAATVHFIVFHAHNGFLEIWLDLGAAGLLLFLLTYLRAWRRLWPALRRGQIDQAAWPLFLLVLIALYDLDENTLLIYNGLFWVLYVSALAHIEGLAAGRRAEMPPPSFRDEIPSETVDAPHPLLSY